MTPVSKRYPPLEEPRQHQNRQALDIKSNGLEGKIKDTEMPVIKASGSTEKSCGGSCEETLTNKRCSAIVARLKPNSRRRLGEIFENDMGFTKFRYEGRGDWATVLSVPDAGIAIRLAPIEEHDYRPNMPEVLQPIHSFEFVDCENYVDPSPSLRVDLLPLGKDNVSYREARSLARSIECRGWYWKESKEPNAIRLPNGKAYIADSASMYPVSGIGRPIIGEGREELPKHYSEVYVGPTLPKDYHIPVISHIGRALQTSVFALRQAIFLRPPWQSWSFDEQLCGIPKKYHPNSEWHETVKEKQGQREQQEAKIREIFKKQRNIDLQIMHRLQKDFHQKEGGKHRSLDSISYKYGSDASDSVREAIVETGVERWFSLDIDERYNLATQEMKKKRENKRQEIR